MHFRNIDYIKNQSFILIDGDFSLLKLGLVFCILVIVMDMCNRFRLVLILKNVKSFDEKVSYQSSSNKLGMMNLRINSI